MVLLLGQGSECRCKSPIEGEQSRGAVTDACGEVGEVSGGEVGMLGVELPCHGDVVAGEGPHLGQLRSQL